VGLRAGQEEAIKNPHGRGSRHAVNATAVGSPPPRTFWAVVGTIALPLP
jgi:hypothetical protein